MTTTQGPTNAGENAPSPFTRARNRLAATMAWLRMPHVLPVAVCLFLGPIMGFALYQPFRLGGALGFVTWFTIAAVFIGLVIAVIQKRSSSFVLRDVTLSIPEFASLGFVVNAEHKRVAWQLFVETASRVSTQSLPADDGFIREALNSLYSLFGTTRDVLKTMDPSRAGDRATVEFFALGMLNKELRPFLAKWHVRLTRFEAAQGTDDRVWPDSMECRADLEALRIRLVTYAQAFGELAGVHGVQAFFDLHDRS